MTENLPSPLFRKEGKKKSWIAQSPEQSPGYELGNDKKVIQRLKGELSYNGF
jgi:hypothetical protein